MGLWNGIGAGIGRKKRGIDWSSYWTTSNLVVEGHSFVAAGSTLPQYILDEVGATRFNNPGVSGATISDVESRAATVDGYLVNETNTNKNILFLWIGVNDLANLGALADGTAVFNDLKSYVDDRIAAGWKVFVFTMTPVSGQVAQFEPQRVIFNNLVRGAASSKIIVIDTDTISELDNPADTTYYSDGLHLTDTGKKLVTAALLTMLTANYPKAVATNYTSSATLTLAATGTGAGVATLTMTANVLTYITVDGNANLYYDSGGTFGARKCMALIAATQRVIYIKCSSGTANIKIRNAEIGKISGYAAVTNAPAIGGSIAQLTDIDYIKATGLNTLSGSVAALTSLTHLEVLGTNTITGSVAALVNLDYMSVTGSNTLTGSIAALTSLTRLECEGSNSLSGAITALTSLTYVYVISAASRISGDIAPIVSDTGAFYLNQNAVQTYTAGATWKNQSVVLRNAVGLGLSVAQMSNMLIDINNSASGPASKTINMSYGNASMADTTQGGIWGDFDGETSPSALATAYKSLIRTKSNSLTIEGIVAPGATGDGTGFPAGFGNWYRS